MKFHLSLILFSAIFLHSAWFIPTTRAQDCPCKAIKLGVDTTKGMKFDTVAYHAVSDSTQLLNDYAGAQAAILALWGMELDSSALQQASETDSLTVKQYGTRKPLPYNYISYVTVGRKGSSLKKFTYKVTLVVKDSSFANDTLVFDTGHASSLAKIPKVLDSLTGTMTTAMKYLIKYGRMLGVDTIRGLAFDEEAYKDSATLLNDYQSAKALADTLLTFYQKVWQPKGLGVVPFGYVEGDIDLGSGLTGNGSAEFGMLNIKNNHCMLDTITMINTTSDTITVQGFDLGQSEYYSLDSIITFDTSKKSPLPASIPVGGSLMAVIHFCHDADTAPLTPEPVVTVPLNISLANHRPESFTLQGQAVHSHYDYISYATLDRKGKTLQNFYYKLSFFLKDAASGDTLVYDTVHETTLANIPQDLMNVVKSISPTIGYLRAHQKMIRADSADHYIGLKYTIIPDRTKIKSGETTNLHVHVYDCDGTDVRGKHFGIKLKEDNQSTLSASDITTDNQGEATVTLTGGPKPETAKASLNYIYISATHHKTAISKCNSKSVTVGAPYQMTVDVAVQLQNDQGGQDQWEWSGTAPMILSKGSSDSCAKFRFVDSTITYTVKSAKIQAKDGEADYVGPMTYTSPVSIQTTGCGEGAQATITINNLASPSGETWVAKGFQSSSPASSIEPILWGIYNGGKMNKDKLMAEGQDRIAKLKDLAAKLQGEGRSGKTSAADYQALMSMVSGQSGGVNPSNFLSAMHYEFKDAINTDPSASTAFDYTPQWDPAKGMQKHIVSSTVHIKIEKQE